MWAKIVSYIIHPAIVPVAGVLITYYILPYYIPEPMFLFVLAYVFAGTYLFPVIIVFGLYKLKFVNSIHLKTRQERVFPFLISAFFYFLTAKAVLQFHFPAELAKFIFAGCLILLIQLIGLKFTKISAHVAGASAILTWLICLSATYFINLLLPIALAIIALAVVSSARLQLKAHTGLEVIGGLLTGCLSVLTLYGW
jgi:membrane-associated phospholipid phosphatase